MRRIWAWVATLLFFFILVPTVAAADTLPHTGRVLVSIGGDLTVPAGERADAVIVVNGVATIAGEVNTVVVIDGTANLNGATAETVVAIRGPVNLGTGTVVSGDILKVDSVVTRYGNAQVGGSVRDVGVELVGLGFILGPALLLLALGFLLATLVAGLAAAGLAERQVRDAGDLISGEPGKTFLLGLGAAIVLPIIGILAVVTIVGAPLGIAFLVAVLPTAALIGYLVVAIWIGEFVLTRLRGSYRAERPYLASVVGIVILMVLSAVPLVTAVASLFGFGSVVLLAWRTWRTGHAPGELPPAVTQGMTGAPGAPGASGTPGITAA